MILILCVHCCYAPGAAKRRNSHQGRRGYTYVHAYVHDRISKTTNAVSVEWLWWGMSSASQPGGMRDGMRSIDVRWACRGCGREVDL